MNPFDVEAVRKDFPILSTSVHGRPLVYLDNAASTQKPKQVMDRIQTLYGSEYANVHRGVHHLSQVSTTHYEGARKKIAKFINAEKTEEIIFTRGATEGINLVAASYGRTFLKAGDEIIISALEHHSNIVPWQILCEQIGAVLRVIPMNERGELSMTDFQQMLSTKTKLVAVNHISNALGTINPVQQIISMAHFYKAVVLIDGAQAMTHTRVDVRELDADFYVFSGHKMCAPTGIGVLYGKKALLDAMPPYQGGGDMIRSVTFEKTTYNDLPYKFEAGTPHIEGAIGLGAAVDYLESLDWEGLQRHEDELLEYATNELSKIPQVRLIGTASMKSSVVSFLIGDVHPHDVGTILDREGVAVRAGNHCAQPVMDFLKIPATVRASFAFYNTKAEVDALVTAVKKVLEFFA